MTGARQARERAPGAGMAGLLRRRRSLLWLIVPYLLYLAALPLTDRVYPVVASMPFFTFWTVIAVLATPLFVWLAARGDPLWRGDAEAGQARGAGDRT